MHSQPRCDLKKIGEVEAKVYGHMNHKGASKRWENLNVENPLQNLFKVQNKVLKKKANETSSGTNLRDKIQEKYSHSVDIPKYQK